MVTGDDGKIVPRLGPSITTRCQVDVGAGGDSERRLVEGELEVNPHSSKI